MNQVKKAVILAAGLGTRFLSITKTIPKEMLPLIDKPVLHYLIDETQLSGIREIILIISPEKEIIKNYFKKNKKLEYFLRVRKEKKYLAEIKKIEKFPKISFLYQEKPLGIGDAVLIAEKKIKNEPFALFFADDVIASKTPCLKQLIDVYKKYQKIIIGVAPVPKKEVFRYGVIKAKKISSRVYQVLDLVEKPAINKAPSNLAITGRYILTPEIFLPLKQLKSQKIQGGKEIYLTDALKILLETKNSFYAYLYQGDWLSCGNKIGWLKANIEIGLKHPETKEELRKYLKDIKLTQLT